MCGEVETLVGVPLCLSTNDALYMYAPICSLNHEGRAQGSPLHVLIHPRPYGRARAAPLILWSGMVH